MKQKKTWKCVYVIFRHIFNHFCKKKSLTEATTHVRTVLFRLCSHLKSSAGSTSSSRSFFFHVDRLPVGVAALRHLLPNNRAVVRTCRSVGLVTPSVLCCTAFIMSLWFQRSFFCFIIPDGEENVIKYFLLSHSRSWSVGFVLFAHEPTQLNKIPSYAVSTSASSFMIICVSFSFLGELGGFMNGFLLFPSCSLRSELTFCRQLGLWSFSHDLLCYYCFIWSHPSPA